MFDHLLTPLSVFDPDTLFNLEELGCQVEVFPSTNPLTIATTSSPDDDTPADIEAMESVDYPWPMGQPTRLQSNLPTLFNLQVPRTLETPQSSEATSTPDHEEDDPTWQPSVDLPDVAESGTFAASFEWPSLDENPDRLATPLPTRRRGVVAVLYYPDRQEISLRSWATSRSSFGSYLRRLSRENPNLVAISVRRRVPDVHGSLERVRSLLHRHSVSAVSPSAKRFRLDRPETFHQLTAEICQLLSTEGEEMSTD